VFAAFFELQPRSGDKVGDSARHERLAALGKSRDPLRDMDGDAGYIARSPLDLACVHTDPYW